MIRTEKTLANFTFFSPRTPSNRVTLTRRTIGKSRSVNLRSEVWVEGRTSPRVRDGRETSMDTDPNRNEIYENAHAASQRRDRVRKRKYAR